ncbi:MAG: sulfatase-like hydrolase/transferase [Armatimonadota bacterium]|nr:sulfatase-like hydrolase/transferase [Armatimonadota bacterium]MCX7777204.1 sulfatase-like hydrolase/transferase [Armatimonadota bacterium]MDW8025031.1 sulfatase-like hydrolase/transferase [Armatimonadota bacterium]
MDRRDFLKNATLGGIALSASVKSSIRIGDSHLPNFVFICADDLGWGDLRCYGHPFAITPNLDKLAQEGIRFTQFYVNSPVCSPSRVAFLTGCFPSRFRIWDYLSTSELNAKRGMPDSLDPKVTTLQKLLKEVGYVCGHFGKWHMGLIEAKEYGFDEYRTFAGGGSNQFKSEHFIRYSSRLIVDEAIRFIETYRNKPFFINVWFFHPHAPLDPDDEQIKPYINRIDKRLTPNRYITPAQVYYAVVTEMDRQIGRLLEKLEELNLAENTVVMFTSDNGPEDIALLEAAHSGVGSPGPFRGRKRSLYEGGIRVPFIVRYPAKTLHGLVDRESVVSGVDFLPTICKLVGIPLPEDLQIDGEDMSEALLGQPKRRKKPLMWEWRFRHFHGHLINKSPSLAIRDGKWKLLMNPDKSRIELYDITNDPMEVNNLAKIHPEVVEILSKKLHSWLATLPEQPRDKDAGAISYQFSP